MNTQNNEQPRIQAAMSWGSKDAALWIAKMAEAIRGYFDGRP